MENSLRRKERETQWVKTEDQLNENSIVVKGLDPGQVRLKDRDKHVEKNKGKGLIPGRWDF